MSSITSEDEKDFQHSQTVGNVSNKSILKGSRSMARRKSVVSFENFDFPRKPELDPPQQ